MFTGIIQEVGHVRAVEHGADGSTLRLELPATAAALRVGDSVAVDGVCLTAVLLDGQEAAFEAMGETLRRTTLGGLRAGDAVNVEPALRAGDPLGGHLVQGHVDAVGRVVSVREDGIAQVVAVDAPAALRRYLVEKGSVGLAGVSLTVSALTETGFEVWLIPHTRQATTLGDLRPGTPLNLEVDQVAKYVERLLAHRA
jgi:riboflavin synthase